MSTFPGHRRRILVVMPNWLGDVVMACPLLDLLHRVRDESGRPLALMACVRRRWAPLLTRDPRLDGLIPYERTGKHAGLSGIIGLARAWRSADLSAVVLCPPSLRMGLTAFLAGIRVRVGERRDGRGSLLTVSLAPVEPRGSLHHSEELRRLGLAFLEHVDLPVPSHAGAAPLLPGLEPLAPMALGQGPPLWVVAPGATYGPAKSWPAARLAEFLGLAVDVEGKRIAVVGDTSAAALVEELKMRTARLNWRRELPGAAGIVDLVGATTVIDLAALLKSAQAFLGNDSGVMHLAAAMSVPTLGLFGSSSSAWTGPLGPAARTLVAGGFSCQPCFRKICNQPSFCLDALSGSDVLTELKALLAVHPAERQP